MEDVGIFNGHFSDFAAKWFIYGHLVHFVVSWNIFPRFGILYRENLATLMFIHRQTLKMLQTRVMINVLTVMMNLFMCHC
jgi:hypothetical protein